MTKLFFSLIALFLFTVLFHVYSETRVESINDCKVIRLVDQTLVGGKESIKTSIRYMVVTDKETFLCESSILNGKFNNSDIFWRLKQDSTYNFKVSGIGKTFFTDYRNIISVSK